MQVLKYCAINTSCVFHVCGMYALNTRNSIIFSELFHQNINNVLQLMHFRVVNVKLWLKHTNCIILSNTSYCSSYNIFIQIMLFMPFHGTYCNTLVCIMKGKYCQLKN